MNRSLMWWFIFLRVVVGAIFLYIGWQRLNSPIVTPEGFSESVSHDTGADNPFPWYAESVGPFLLKYPEFLAPISAWGVMVIGAGLVVGLFMVAALIVGMLINLNDFFMAGWTNAAYYGLNALMFLIQLGLLVSGVWRSLTLDSILWKKRKG